MSAVGAESAERVVEITSRTPKLSAVEAMEVTSTPASAPGSSGDDVGSRGGNRKLKHGTVPHAEYFLYRCIYILETEGKNNKPAQLTSLWQRLAALRRYISCIKCDKILCEEFEVRIHPILYRTNEEIVFCMHCFDEAKKLIENRPTQSKSSDEYRRSALDFEGRGGLKHEDYLLVEHSIEKYPDEWASLSFIPDVARAYVKVCQSIITLDQTYFPWNRSIITTWQEFKNEAWPFLEQSAMQTDSDDPQSDDILGLLIESLNHMQPKTKGSG